MGGCCGGGHKNHKPKQHKVGNDHSNDHHEGHSDSKRNFLMWAIFILAIAGVIYFFS